MARNSSTTCRDGVRYMKQCSCKSTALTGMYRTHTTYDGDGSVEIETIFYPGPSCDECGTPWKQVS